MKHRTGIELRDPGCASSEGGTVVAADTCSQSSQSGKFMRGMPIPRSRVDCFYRFLSGLLGASLVAQGCK